MIGRFRQTMGIVLCTVLAWGSMASAVTLSGRVYEGQTGVEPPAAKAIQGATVSLYGADDAGQMGTYITHTTTDSDGWYGLWFSTRGDTTVYDYYNIVATAPAGYTSEGATSVSGSVEVTDWIQYEYDWLSQTTTGNKFWFLPVTAPPENRPPVANDDSVTVLRDHAIEIYVLNNDSDPDGDALSEDSVTDPPHGEIPLIYPGGSGGIVYQPDPGFVGTDTFDYTVTDGRGGTDTATVTVYVVDEQTPPEPPEGEWDFGDAPEGKMGRITYYYPTTMENNGARHRIDVQGPWLGAWSSWGAGSPPDAEPGGQPNVDALGDDDNGSDDESREWVMGSLMPGRTTDQRLGVYGGGGHVDIWIDSNQDGNWQHPQERVFSRDLADGDHWVSYVVPADAVLGETYARMRINSGGPLPPHGPADDGEVSDEKVIIYGLDYGDAPDPPYPTLEVNGGPCTRVTDGLFFGTSVDGELDGQQDAHALGDDNDGTDDDDGVTFLTKLIPGREATVAVVLSGTRIGDGHGNQEEFFAWIDFNRNGQWEDSEMIIRQEIDTHTGTCTFIVPNGALLGSTYARFALDILSTWNPSPKPTNETIWLNDIGEVEDYEIVIGEDGPYPAGPPSGGDCGDANGDGVVDMTDAVYILDYLYLGGPPPTCDLPYCCADTDGSGLVDISDATTLLQHLFLGVPLPANACCQGSGQPQLDWGDAPYDGKDYFYPEASHVPGPAWLGDLSDQPDLEPTMLRDLQALADDKNNKPDENGLILAKFVKDPGALSTLRYRFVFNPQHGYTAAQWIDWDGDGNWGSDEGGYSATYGASWAASKSQVGEIMCGYIVPNATTPGPTYLRLRVYDGYQQSPSPAGPAGPGEVEDHLIEIEPGGPALPSGGIIVGLKWNDLDGDGLLDPGEPRLAGWTIRYDSNGDGILDSRDASTTTGTDGQFTFTGVRPGTYLVGEDQQPGWTQTFPLEPGTHTVTVQPGQKFFIGLFFGNRESGPGGAGGIRVHLKWSQPPIEIDPDVEEPPVFCGWGESACSTEQTGQRRQWRMLVDDFRCLGDMPITAIRWWGSYQSWQSPEVPEHQPLAWHVGFWTNTVDGLAPEELYPERLVWSLVLPNERVLRRSKGLCEFPQQVSEMCFAHGVRLEPQEWFHQAEFASNEGVFWLSVTAVYPPDAEPVNLWNWTTRPHTWGRGAQMPAIMGEWPSSEERLSPGRITPVETARLCRETRTYDLCFDLLTESPWVKWDQPFVGLRKWPGYADHISTAFEPPRGALTVQRQVADDWTCESADPITAISWQGSYLGYGYEGCKCDEVVEPRRPDYFLLSIWADTPPVGQRQERRPSEKVWEYAAYDYDEVLVGYDRQPEGEPNEAVFRYSVRLPAEAWFRQETPEAVFWFSVTAVFEGSATQIPYHWGWTSHEHTFGSAAMATNYDAGTPRWQETLDDGVWPVDMSFTLYTAPQSGAIAHWRLDETQGTIAADSVGGHDGNVHGATWTQGVVGGALRLNGENCVEVADDAAFDLTEAITVAAWVNLEAVPAEWIGIVTKGDSTWRLSTLLSERRFHFAVNDPEGVFHAVDGTTRVGLNEWHHVAGTYSASHLRLYVDGVEDPVGPAAYTGPINTDDFPVWIGANAERPGRNLVGRIDDVRIYDRALSETEIVDLVALTD